MSEELPEPLTPADCDLRSFPHMPLMVARLLTSEWWITACMEEPAAAAAAVNLWATAWHQVPAGSLPDSDIVLWKTSQLTREDWDRVRARVTGPWVRCSDGRLYHPVVAEIAREAYGKRTKASDAGKLGNEIRWGSGSDRVAIGKRSGRNRTAIAEGSASDSQPIATQSQREEKRGDEREEQQQRARASSPEDQKAIQIIQAFDQARTDAYGASRARPYPHAMDLVHARRWAAAGHDPQALYGLFLARQQARAAKGKDPIESLGFLEAAVAELAGVAAPQGTVTSAAIRFMSPEAELRARRDWFNREREAANARGDAPPTDLARFGLWYDAHGGQQIRLMAGDRPPIPPAAPREATG